MDLSTYQERLRKQCGNTDFITMKALSEATKIHRTVLHKILNGLPRVAGKLFLPDVAKVLYEKFQPKTKRLG